MNVSQEKLRIVAVRWIVPMINDPATEAYRPICLFENNAFAFCVIILFSFNRADRANLGAVAAMQSVLMFDHGRGIAEINATLRTDRAAGLAADTGVRYEISFFLALCLAKGERRSFYRLL